MKQMRISLKHHFIPIIAAILLFLAAIGCKKDNQQVVGEIARPVKIITVAGTENNDAVSLPGKTRANRRADLSFKVSGPLAIFPVEEGQKLPKGELIARIDPRDFETNIKEITSTLSEEKAKLKAMQRGARIEDIRTLEAQVEAAKAECLYAEDQYSRYKQLWTKQHVSRADFDRQTSLRDTAKAQLDIAGQNLAKGKKGARQEDVDAQKYKIRGLESKLKAAIDALDDTYLKAPFDGVVARRYVENHQEIRAKEPVVSFQDISSIEVLVDVPEIQAAKIQEGAFPDMEARFAAAPDRRFPLTLKEFSTEADPGTQTYQAVLVMPHPKNINILPGMTATVTASPGYSRKKDIRIVIPASAVTRDTGKKPYAWILDKSKMTVVRTDVQIGELSGSDGIEILKGLNPGDQVVVAGVTKLRAGMKVSIWKTSL
ncbi:efflux RND transporter periplasmic adaptor subunit [Desulfobacter postgatei]|uniref:efflux RND transporter periplasmic adaptor subunit n=1 Tax=Desulfobacter postgatei TaxID=2293 RepID=UPI00259B7B14|nr:efflux RND transporter periplasmic adaptor subunit [uncultured Desulfobacter sp.]